MKKRFTYSVEENLLNYIKINSLKEGYSSVSDYITFLVTVGMVYIQIADESNDYDIRSFDDINDIHSRFYNMLLHDIYTDNNL